MLKAVSIALLYISLSLPASKHFVKTNSPPEAQAAVSTKKVFPLFLKYSSYKWLSHLCSAPSTAINQYTRFSLPLTSQFYNFGRRELMMIRKKRVPPLNISFLLPKSERTWRLMMKNMLRMRIHFFHSHVFQDDDGKTFLY